jgi:hypothetical protein
MKIRYLFTVLAMAFVFNPLTNGSGNTCDLLLGSGPLRIVIVPAGFDEGNPTDVAHFVQLSEKIAYQGYGAIPPYDTNTDRFSLFRVNDYRGQSVDATTNDVWYNQTLISAASLCDYDQIIVVANNSGWAGGAPGFYSVVGSGTPSTCDPATCTGTGCPWTPTCSWDYNIAYTALHETGHTFAGLRHTCYPLSPQEKLLDSMEQDVVGAFEFYNPASPAADDPINCGVGFTGDPENVCSEWNTQAFLSWVFPKDPHFGCYLGCDNNANWYRPWYTTENMMCIDLDLKNGFTPVDRKKLSDFLGGTPPNCLNLALTVNANQGSVAVSPDPNCNAGYYPNTLIRLAATPNPGYVFWQWSGDVLGCRDSVEFAITKDMAVTANFTNSGMFCGETFLPGVYKELFTAR